MLDRVSDWREYLESGVDDTAIKLLEKHSNTGRPLGDEAFLDTLEQKLGRVLRPLKPGRKRKAEK
jgi:putative transposase